jgi:hypothetical protein
MSALSLLAALVLAQAPAAQPPSTVEAASAPAPAPAAQQPASTVEAAGTPSPSAVEAASAPAPSTVEAAGAPAPSAPGPAAPAQGAPQSGAALEAQAPATVKALPPPPALPPVPPGADGTPVKVERRRLLKQKHVFITAGPTYLARGDYYRSPGLSAALSYYPYETGGMEVKLALLFSTLTTAGREVFERTGLVPDAHRPSFVGAVGWRQSVGYGKALVGSSLTHLVHFDLQLAGHLGLTFTDRAANPTLALGPGLLVRTRTLFLQVDAPFVGSLESRSRSSLALGMLPSFTLGFQL